MPTCILFTYIVGPVYMYTINAYFRPCLHAYYIIDWCLFCITWFICRRYSTVITHVYGWNAASPCSYWKLRVSYTRLVCIKTSSVKSRQNWDYMVGSRSNWAKLHKDDLCLRLGSIVINPSETVRDLGVLLDGELTMRPYIARTSSTCFSTFVGCVNFVDLRINLPCSVWFLHSLLLDWTTAIQ